ncbi:MAG: cation-translocating P-type ATPase [Candidatus Peribacteraceae bacterium]|jgi:Ca2+-transporting ATPase|nr:cation-translocating P-type ATPase [Candidatus Peribacteraceae bacterium]MDP7645865.1 cation-translocating P-type ATPase [Candidatus Peribacteraceae bacterium]|tara:strand:+ start:871 stop:3354 length:2484 start_codon:yes stop_codon:yes gene_type:complete
MYANLKADDVLSRLGSSLNGLKTPQIKKRRAEFGFNELPHKKRSLIALFLRQFNDILVYILIGALALSIAMPFLAGHALTFESFLDAIVIGAILILNAVLGFVQEFKAEEAIAMLQKLSAPRVRVRRNGGEKIIESRELLPGDIVIIEAGDMVSADGRIITLSHLRINESSLTGEHEAVSKKENMVRGKLPLAEQHNMVFRGTLVTRGSGEYVVTSIGLHTEIGKIAKLVSETEFPETPLQRKMKKLGQLLGLVVVALCAIVIGIGYVKSLPFIDILLIGVSLAVSAVPEGLPAVVTVCLALGVRRMVSKNALVRRLDSLETLGAVTVICADKTGTITENRMKVKETWTGGGGKEGGEDLIAEVMGSCNRAQWPNLGDPTEVGLLRFSRAKKANRLHIDNEEVPFTSESKYMQTRHGRKSYIKGAPEVVVRLCDSVNKKEVLDKNDEFARKGLRVLAAAIKEGGKTKFLGLVAMEDPPRQGVKEAIESAKHAGIRTIMITGDNIVTAKAIAQQVGIEGDAMTGQRMSTLSKKDLKKALKHTSIFARVSPSHKLDILAALQSKGEIVAMSGDGVNDAPALKGSHVGIAMGKNGTEVAREAASIVLADDHYSTIVNAIREGRRIYDNIKKFIVYLLRANFDELLLIMTVLILGLPLPYLPIHILWINLMTDGLPALALGMEKAEADIMDRPPRDPKEHLLSGEWGRLVLAGFFAFALAFVFFLWQISHGVELIEARTTTFTLAVLFELFLAFNIRSRRPIWKIGFFSNKWLIGAVTVPLMFHMVLLYTPLSVFFRLVPLDLGQWGIVILLAFSGFALFEVLKLVPSKSR